MAYFRDLPDDQGGIACMYMVGKHSFPLKTLLSLS